MRLSDGDIINWLKDGLISITPYPKLNSINGVTVDMHLSNKFRIFKDYNRSFVDLSISKTEIAKLINKIMSKEMNLNDNDNAIFYLYPGEFALAFTYESVTLPKNLVGWIDGRSSLARFGLMIHMTANRIDPGWSGCIILELFNAGRLTIALRPGMIIGALSFELLTRSVDFSYNQKNNDKI